MSQRDGISVRHKGINVRYVEAPGGSPRGWWGAMITTKHAITELLREGTRDERAEQKVYNRVEHIGNRSKAY